MDKKEVIHRLFPFLKPEDVAFLEKELITKKFGEGQELLREGQYVKVIPIVMEGLVKVYTKREDKELLLYYIRPGEGCVMTFFAGLMNSPSLIAARTEESAEVLLLPVTRLEDWIHRYPSFNKTFYKQFHHRYLELVEMIQQMIFETLDERLFQYLKTKSEVLETKLLEISHRQIAGDLGTAREVVSRLMKKLESEGKVRQRNQGIEFLGG